MNVNTLYVDVFLFNVVITLYSFFFSESNISMIRSKSSSLLNGILILPFPLAVHESCTFEPKNPQRWLCSKVYSSDSLEPLVDLLPTAVHCLATAQCLDNFFHFADRIAL